MTEVKFTVFFICLLIFTIIDKGITLINLQQIQKNFPHADAIGAEKNPINRFFFNKFGLYGGTIAMLIFSLGYYILAWYVLLWIFGTQYQNIFLYIWFLIFGFTISNNFYFYLKYSGIIK